MKLKDLPQRWIEKLPPKVVRESIQYIQYWFFYRITIYFEDQSKVIWENAYSIFDETTDEFLIVTEHNGYHIYSKEDYVNLEQESYETLIDKPSD